MFSKLCLFVICCAVAFSVQAADIQVVDVSITSAIENRMPVDNLEVYPADYGKLYCFTRIVGAEGETQVTHVWFYEDQEMARVTLPVQSADWRTFSSKRFLPQWIGQWSVVIEDQQGSSLAQVMFRLE
ncbi:DUF2914 domain-containing protein [Pelovirga terrestris]|uniref:DUF2914 domain-containing protein n=1 Tax=Pelovirga terrestris TaxID=2771352 RepID=A0A8J6R4N3_9BACT|nr:DUF2914 domain-containing protein [Pelovirga terrestris]MBD1399384.1 DUF2914 domain-containing protein [Pelovirga terrestris]